MHHNMSELSNALFPDMGRQSPPGCGLLFVMLIAATLNAGCLSHADTRGRNAIY